MHPNKIPRKKRERTTLFPVLLLSSVKQMHISQHEMYKVMYDKMFQYFQLMARLCNHSLPIYIACRSKENFLAHSNFIFIVNFIIFFSLYHSIYNFYLKYILILFFFFDFHHIIKNSLSKIRQFLK